MRIGDELCVKRLACVERPGLFEASVPDWPQRHCAGRASGCLRATVARVFLRCGPASGAFVGGHDHLERIRTGSRGSLHRDLYGPNSMRSGPPKKAMYVFTGRRLRVASKMPFICTYFVRCPPTPRPPLPPEHWLEGVRGWRCPEPRYSRRGGGTQTAVPPRPGLPWPL